MIIKGRLEFYGKKLLASKKEKWEMTKRQIGTFLFILLLIIPLAYASGEPLSIQIANYTIDVKLDTEKHLLTGKENLSWTNISDVPIGEIWFHLYWNAFKNNRSTLWSEAARADQRAAAGWKDADWGYCQISSLKLLKNSYLDEIDLLPTLEYKHPDDDNLSDQTVFSIRLPKSLEPGQSATLAIDFESKVPRPIYNAGVFRDFYFICQWFPKVGVFSDGKWDCHQHHFGSEYFSEFGTYDVKITLPRPYVVGASGERKETVANFDGTSTHHFYQQNIHDFAWTAYPHFLRYEETYEFVPGKTVELVLLLQPHHKHLKDRYLNALKAALTSCSLNLMDYPYPTITCVDPIGNCNCSGMEYPTLFTGGAYFIAPRKATRPENVTVHEFIHNYFYGIIGTNEFEHAWMDEGMTSFFDTEVYYTSWGEPLYSKSYFGIPVTFRGVPVPIESEGMIYYIQAPDWDNLQTFSWTFSDVKSYTANAYGKSELMLRTLQRLMGKERFSDMFKAYAGRWRFKHPEPRDFIGIVNEFSAQDMSSFLEQVIFGSEKLDFALSEIHNRQVPRPRGLFDDTGAEGKQETLYESAVLVRRLGGLKVPVDVLIAFENGEKIRTFWDGRERWKRFAFRSPAKIESAIVDPDFKLVLDVNRANNSMMIKPERLGALKWTSKWLLWLQHALELLTMFAG